MNMYFFLRNLGIKEAYASIDTIGYRRAKGS